MKRIGLTQRVAAFPEREERRDCLDQRWARLLLQLGMLPIPIPNLGREILEWTEELALDGLILSGGNDLASLPGACDTAPERDLSERLLLDFARRTGTPVLGVCRGMQMMLCESGAQLRSLVGHVGSRHPIAVDSACPLPLEDRQEVNSYHNYGFRTEDLGSEWIPAALVPDGTVEAVCHVVHRHWAIMWHPERAPFEQGDRELVLSLFADND